MYKKEQNKKKKKNKMKRTTQSAGGTLRKVQKIDIGQRHMVWGFIVIKKTVLDRIAYKFKTLPWLVKASCFAPMILLHRIVKAIKYCSHYNPLLPPLFLLEFNCPSIPSIFLESHPILHLLIG